MSDGFENNDAISITTADDTLAVSKLVSLFSTTFLRLKERWRGRRVKSFLVCSLISRWGSCGETLDLLQTV